MSLNSLLYATYHSRPSCRKEPRGLDNGALKILWGVKEAGCEVHFVLFPPNYASRDWARDTPPGKQRQSGHADMTKVESPGFRDVEGEGNPGGGEEGMGWAALQKARKLLKKRVSHKLHFNVLRRGQLAPGNYVGHKKSAAMVDKALL
jgi:hypothetical protein